MPLATEPSISSRSAIWRPTSQMDVGIRLPRAPPKPVAMRATAPTPSVRRTEPMAANISRGLVKSVRFMTGRSASSSPSTADSSCEEAVHPRWRSSEA